MHEFQEGMAWLRKNCSYMREIINLSGYPQSRKRPHCPETLFKIICNQQISVTSGAAIWENLSNSLGDVTAESILRVGEEGLTNMGLSKAKASYVFGIADAVKKND